jgi:hypothetical protein
MKRSTGHEQMATEGSGQKELGSVIKEGKALRGP